jgi:hypothetical protein
MLNELYHEMDIQCANTLGIPIDEYISKIEAISFYRATVIIKTLLDNDNPQKIEQTKRIFKNILI